MSMTRSLGAVAVAVAAAAAVVAAPSPASADHGAYAGHWGHGFDPWVEPAPHLAGWAFAAVDRWNSFGVRSQMNKGTQDGDCDVVNGEISVCGRNSGYQSGGFTLGVNAGALATNYKNADGHLRASVVEICQNCGYSSAFQQYALSHELGHSMGLNHTTDCASAVNSVRGCNPQFASSPHERDSLRFWYNHTD